MTDEPVHTDSGVRGVLLPEVSRWLCRPHRRHRHASDLEHRARRWASDCGLAAGPAAVRLRAQGIDQLAATAMSEERDEQVLLYARWLIWLFSLDDHVESHTDPHAIDTMFGNLLARTEVPDTDIHSSASAVHGTASGPAHVIERAFAELWQQTSRGMGSDWRARFSEDLRYQHTGCLRELRLRRSGTVPTIAEYPLLRRQSGGMWIYDLPEAILGIELPPAFAATTLWHQLVCHVSDAANWCNDILSCPKEITDRVTMNYVLVARHELGLNHSDADQWVVGRIVARLDQAAALGQRVPDIADHLGLPPATIRDISRIACATLNFPAAYLTWALDSLRYMSRPPTQHP